MSDTIAAIATGNIISAIGIIRLSGDEAITIADKVFTPNNGGQMKDKSDRKLILGEAKDKNGRLLDCCLCTISHGPNSYTGEDTAEFQCHGSPVVLRLILEALFAAGARQAKAGEFTKRAFINGRMDLTQAEAVIDLIDSETDEAARNAAAQLGGAILNRINAIYDNLADIVSHYDAVLDYYDEDIEDFQIEKYKNDLNLAEKELNDLLSSFERGKIMKSGVSAAIVGRPNAGKSSLLNALLGYDRAIVTNIPGTTRDVIEEKLTLGGVLLRLSDTAGIRGTDDPVERIGVDRAISAAGSAELVLAVFDGSEQLTQEDREAIEAAVKAKEAIAVINKCDLPQKLNREELDKRFSVICPVSALDKTGLEALEDAVRTLFPVPDVPAGEILTNSRHADAIGRAAESIKEAISSLEIGCSPDIVLTEVETAMSALGELTGRTVIGDVTQRIFSRFCVGK